MPSKGPTLHRIEKLCRDIGETIGDVADRYNAAFPDDPKIGFTLLMFTFGDESAGRQWMTYISNANRDDMRASMEEFLDKQVQEDMESEPE